MSKLIGKIFNFQEKTREKIIKNDALLNKAKIVFIASRITFDIYMLFLFLVLFLQIPITNLNDWIFIIIGAVSLVSGFISNIKNMCTNIRDFLKIASFSTFTLGSIILIILLKYFDLRNFSYFLIIVIFTVIWTFLSTFSENNIGKLSNAIVAAILVISLQANSFIWSEKELALLKSNVSSSNIEGELVSYKIQELAINKVLFPLFVMTTIGALACAYKEYWLEKNKDKLNKIKEESKKVGKY